MRSVDASFARSFDPCSSILTMHGAPKQRLRGGAIALASRLGKPTRVGGTSTGVECSGQRGSPRVTASARERRGTSRKGRGSRPPSLRGSRVPVVLLARRVSLQKSAGDLWSRIRSAYALQKGRSGSSERGPSSEFRSAGETVGRGVGRRERRESASPLKTGEVRRKAQGGARASSSGHDIAKSGGVVVGPGL